MSAWLLLHLIVVLRHHPRIHYVTIPPPVIRHLWAQAVTR